MNIVVDKKQAVFALSQVLKASPYRKNKEVTIALQEDVVTFTGNSGQLTIWHTIPATVEGAGRDVHIRDGAHLLKLLKQATTKTVAMTFEDGLRLLDGGWVPAHTSPHGSFPLPQGTVEAATTTLERKELMGAMRAVKGAATPARSGGSLSYIHLNPMGRAVRVEATDCFCMAYTQIATAGLTSNTLTGKETLPVAVLSVLTGEKTGTVSLGTVDDSTVIVCGSTVMLVRQVPYPNLEAVVGNFQPSVKTRATLKPVEGKPRPVTLTFTDKDVQVIEGFHHSDKPYAVVNTKYLNLALQSEPLNVTVQTDDNRRTRRTVSVTNSKLTVLFAAVTEKKHA